jgi:hypothetical protein
MCFYSCCKYFFAIVYSNKAKSRFVNSTMMVFGGLQHWDLAVLALDLVLIILRFETENKQVIKNFCIWNVFY